MSETASSLEALEPRPIWHHFDGIRRIPRPSKKEERIVRHVLDWAEEHGFTHRQDAAGNLVVVVPASAGREGAPTVVLQSHLDMVCEKNAGVEHDFDADPIRVRVEGEWVKAVGTTLGADNGMGAAAAMAVAVDEDVQHGPLELLFTLDEETGLNGAAALDPELVSGRLLLNLDTEEDDAIYIGCAGAGGVEATFPLERREEEGSLYELAVRGLPGGHSGMEIHRPLGNATKVAVQVLRSALEAGLGIGLVSLAGGSKANAIPRECFARLRLAAADRDALRTVAKTVRQAFQAAYSGPADGLEVTLEPCAVDSGGPPDARSILPAHRDRLLDFLADAPHGVLAMSQEVPGLVETSCNLAIVRTGSREATVFCSFRSSVNEALERETRRLVERAEAAGGSTALRRGYPGWRPRPESPLVKRTSEVYARLFGEPPGIKAVHAGLECGILIEKLPGLEAVSFGPEIRGAHSPDERVRIPSVAKFYRWLAALLDELSR
jgi:dipeptidase D